MIHGRPGFPGDHPQAKITEIVTIQEVNTSTSNVRQVQSNATSTARSSRDARYMLARERGTVCLFHDCDSKERDNTISRDAYHDKLNDQKSRG